MEVLGNARIDIRKFPMPPCQLQRIFLYFLGDYTIFIFETCKI